MIQIIACQEERTQHTRILPERRRQRAKKEAFKCYGTVEMKSSTSSSGLEEPSQDDADASGSVRPLSQKKAKRANKNIVTSSLTGALNQTKVSDRKALFLLTETSRALGKNVEELNRNRSSISRQLMKHRAQIAKKLKDEFKTVNPCLFTEMENNARFREKHMLIVFLS